MQQYAVVYFPKVTLEKVQILREKYDPMVRVLPPHITLVFPFLDISEDEIITHLSTVTRDFAQFPIRFNGFEKSFDNYLFLLVKEGEETIERLYGELYSGILADHMRDDLPFVPHITVGDFTKNTELYPQALAEAENLGIDRQTIFDNLTLIKGDGVSPATVIQEFSLL